MRWSYNSSQSSCETQSAYSTSCSVHLILWKTTWPCHWSESCLYCTHSMRRFQMSTCSTPAQLVSVIMLRFDRAGHHAQVVIALTQYLPLVCRQFSISDCGEKDYKELLEQYPKVTRVYNSLDKESRHVIQYITHRMGVGMAEFIEKEVVTLEDFDLYCHYVAGAGLLQLEKEP